MPKRLYKGDFHSFQISLQKLFIMPFLGIGTVATAIFGGKSLLSSVEDLLEEAGELIDDVSDLVTDITTNVNQIIDKLSETYQDNLNVTLDSLGEFTGGLLRKLTDTFYEINEVLMNNVEYIINSAKDLLEDLKNKLLDIIQQVEKSITNILIVAGETASYVVDRVIYNLLNYSSWVLFGIGLIIFITTLAKRGIPEGGAGILMLVLMGIFIFLFGAIGLIPKFRSYIIRFTGLGLKAKLEEGDAIATTFVSRLYPSTIEIGKTKELQIKGLGLLPNGQQPSVRINGTTLPIKAAADDVIVVDVSKVDLPNGSSTLMVDYPDIEQFARVIQIKKINPPADLVVTKIRTNPKYPIVGQTFTTTIGIKNYGKTTAKNFQVGWAPDVGQTYISENVSSLKAGQSTNVTLRHKYKNGKVYSSLAAVDYKRTVQESKENNNTRALDISVVPTHWKVGFKFISFTFEDVPTGIEETIFNIAALNWSQKSTKKPKQVLGLDKTFYNVDAGTKLILAADLKLLLLGMFSKPRSVRLFELDLPGTKVSNGFMGGPWFLNGFKQKTTTTKNIHIKEGYAPLKYSLTFEWSIHPH